MRVGLAGTGRMGSAVALRLLELGHTVTVYNRTPPNAEPLLEAGAALAAAPADLVAGSDVVITTLLDDRAVDEVYGALLAHGGKGRRFVDMSTVRTATTLRVRDLVETAGGRLVDAPVAGPPQAARAGKLLVLAGGDAADLAAVSPLLDAVGRRVVHLGPSGSGATMKLVLMTCMAVYFAGLAEALAVGSQLGLDLEDMLDVIRDSHGAPPVLHDRAPVLLAEAAGRSAPVGFPVAGVRKDLEAVVATAQDAGVPGATAAAALATFTAASGTAFGERDLVCVAEYLMQLCQRTSPAPALAEAMTGRVELEAAA
jgi:3-hydroxyisobutyrate dehydrogenase-like beta-hydroxyacid dehydrogenase